MSGSRTIVNSNANATTMAHTGTLAPGAQAPAAAGPARNSGTDTWGVQVLVGNKSDVEDSKRKVSYARGKELADEYGIQFFETSAKANINVDEVRHCPVRCASCQWQDEREGEGSTGRSAAR